MLLCEQLHTIKTHTCRGKYAHDLKQVVESVLVENDHAETGPGKQDECLVDRNALHLIVQLNRLIQKLQLRVRRVDCREAEDNLVENVVHKIAHLEDCVADLQQEDA